MTKEEETRGPWNEGSSTQLKEEWQYIDKPQEYVTSTDGLTNVTPKGTDRTEKMVKEKDEKLDKERKKMILSKTPAKDMQWSHYQPDGNMKKNSKTNKHSN